MATKATKATETTYCTNPACPSRGKARRTLAAGLCRGCHTRAWRRGVQAATVAYTFRRAAEWLAAHADRRAA